MNFTGHFHHFLQLSDEVSVFVEEFVQLGRVVGPKLRNDYWVLFLFIKLFEMHI